MPCPRRGSALARTAHRSRRRHSTRLSASRQQPAWQTPRQGAPATPVPARRQWMRKAAGCRQTGRWCLSCLPGPGRPRPRWSRPCSGWQGRASLEPAGGKLRVGAHSVPRCCSGSHSTACGRTSGRRLPCSRPPAASRTGWTGVACAPLRSSLPPRKQQRLVRATRLSLLPLLLLHPMRPWPRGPELPRLGQCSRSYRRLARSPNLPRGLRMHAAWTRRGLTVP
mmetsp:Transcript_2899/g.11755  ORF Transcript_2899/g.11755 Transcript_2899/m.11755 type:complete len:224 (+) Transcript_2899:5557-6228(+)